jgi:outer membrane receptor protein involved in Fe transport
MEALVPLLADIPGIRRLDLNGALRLADYSSVGLQTTWKLGAQYEPVDGLRLRVTRSRDLRAPAIHEIANPGSQTTTNLTVRGFTGPIPTVSGGGNPHLQPEVGDTFSAGLVVEPSAIPGLHLSADYYDIAVDQAITTIQGITVAAMCDAGNQQFCDFFTFNAAGAPTALRVPVVNAASVRNKGIDFLARYRLPVGEESSVTLNFSGNYTLNVDVNLGLGSPTIDRAGENSNYNNYALPRFRSNLELVYDRPGVQFGAEAVFVSAGTIDNTFNLTTDTSANINHVRAAVTFNLSTKFTIGDEARPFEFFARIDNLLNRWPPAIPNQTGFIITNGQYYSNIGRAFRVGVSKTF